MIFLYKYNLYEIMPAVFLLEVKGNKNLASIFLRAQEFYESTNDSVRGKSFTIEEYKKWYKTLNEKNEFSYAKDWQGFNISSDTLEMCYQINKERKIEDYFLLDIAKICKKISSEKNYKNYYLLGAKYNDVKVLRHELAHALFYTNSEYKKIMVQHFASLPIKFQKKMSIILGDLGYYKDVHIDEAQAYFATGMTSHIKKQLTPQQIGYSEAFKKVYKSYIIDINKNIIIIGNINNNDS